MTIDAKRLEEVKAAARKMAPEADPAECAAALLVVVYNAKIRERVKGAEPRLWDQILHALGPLAPAEEEPEAPRAVVKVPPLTRGKRARGEPKPEAPPDDVAGGI